jgi:hypothetical protein
MCVLWSISMTAQFERNGVPVSWGLSQQSELIASWEVLPSLNVSALLAEDQQEVWDRSKPYRFASAVQTDFTTQNSGRWSNLLNGDRIWILGIEVGSSYSISVTLRNLNLPRGGKIYIYNEDHTDYLGPLTSRDNTSGFLGIPHMNGSRIIIEYYEPYAYRGEGSFRIDHVAGSYRDLSDATESSDISCYSPVIPVSSATGTSRVASSVLMMMVDYGQRISTATMLNNSSSDATPYVLTASSCLIGPASSWVFYFSMNQFRCSGLLSCELMATSGATIVRNDSEQGLSLLKLLKAPPASWDTYYSGWSLSNSEVSSRLVSLHHAEALQLASSEYHPSWTETTAGGASNINLELSAAGRTFQGSAGAPLFDNEWNLLGIFVGGDGGCNTEGQDRFVLLSESWSAMRTYLDPLQIVQDKIQGIYPDQTFGDLQTVEQEISFFPNPAEDWIFVHNESESRILEVVLMNVSGQIIQTFQPTVPTISIDGLPEGLYFIQFVTGKDRFTHQLMIR